MTNRRVEPQQEALRIRKREDEQESSPGQASPATLQTLQHSLGNRALARLLESDGFEPARDKASAEPATPVSNEVQAQVDTEANAGQARAGLTGIRLHQGPAADRLARRLGARAFTQGRDVFLGARARADTLPHELAHVGQDAPGSGNVHLQADTETKPEEEEKEDELPRVSMALPGPDGKPTYVTDKKKFQTLDEFNAGPKGPPLDPKVEAMVEGTYKPSRDEIVEKQFDQKMYDEEQLRRGRAAMTGEVPGAKTEKDANGWTSERDPGDLNVPIQAVGASLSRDAKYSETVTSQPSTGGEEMVDPDPRLPTIGPKKPEAPKVVEPFVPQKFDFSITIDNIKKEFSGLSADQAIVELKHEWQWCWDLLDIYKRWHQELKSNRDNHPIVGFIADRMFGHGDPPPMTIWNMVENDLVHAGLELKKSDEQLKAEFEARQKKDEASEQVALQERFDKWKVEEKEYRTRHPDTLGITRDVDSVTLDEFKKYHDMNNRFRGFDARQKYHAWETFMERHVGSGAHLLEEAAAHIQAQRESVFYYKEGSIKGAETAVKVLTVAKKAGAFAASMLPIGRGLGLVRGAMAMGAVSGGYTAISDFAGQAGEMAWGERTEFDFAEIGRDALKDGVTGFVAGLAAGGLGKVFGNALKRRLAAKLGKELTEVELSAIQNWLIGAGSGIAASPLNAPTRMVLERAMGQRKTLSLGEIMDQIIDQTPENILMAAVGATLGAKMHGEGPAQTPRPEPVAKAAPEPAPSVTEPVTAKEPVAAPAPVPAAVPAGEPVTVAPVAEPVATTAKTATTPMATGEPTAAPPATPRVRAKPPPIPPLRRRAASPKSAGARKGGGKTGEPSADVLSVGDKRTTTRAIGPRTRPSMEVTEPTADDLAVGDKRTTTRAIGERTRPSTEVTEPTADELAVGDKRTMTRAIDERARPTTEVREPTADELAVGDQRTTTRAAPEDTGAATEEMPVAERPTQQQEAVPGPEEPAREVYGPVEPGIKELPDETVIQLDNGWDQAGARQVYEKMVAETRGREAALYYNPETGQYIIVQGNEGTAAVARGEGPVAGKAQRWKEILDVRDGGRWELQNHSHPNGEGGVVDPVNQVASGAGGDMSVVAGESINAGGQPRSSVIDYMTAEGPKQTEFGFDPNLERPFWLQLPDGAPRLEFRTIEDYHSFLATNFPGQVAFHPIPEWLSGTKPVQWARQAAYEAQSAQRPTQRMNAQAATQEMPSQGATQVMNVEAPTQEMPSQRTTQRMPAEMPTQEMPSQRTTQRMPAEMPTQEMPSQRTTQRMDGTGGGPPPLPEGASGRITGRMEAQGGAGEPPPMPAEGPLGRGRSGPVEPQDVIPIESEIEANQILNTQVQARRPIRLIPNHDDVVDAWRDEYGQQGGDPPPAWMDESGKIVVDASRVKTIGTLSGPIPPPRPRAEPGGQTMGTEPPRSRGEDGVYNDEEALPPWEPRQFEPPRVETRIDDATEAESAFWDADAASPDNPPGMTFDTRTYQANWELAGGKGTAPPGWIDQYGRLNVDANRVNVHQGPAPVEGGPDGGGTRGGPGPSSEMPGGPGAGVAPRASKPEGGEDKGPSPMAPVGEPESAGGGVVEQEMPESGRTTAKMGRVSAADVVRRRGDGLRYIRENDVRFYHATNRAIVRLIEHLDATGRAWASDGGGLWVTTDPTSPFFGEGQVSVQRTQQIYGRYGVPFDDAAAKLAQEPVFFEVNLEALPSPSSAGDVMGEFAPDAPGRSKIATDFKISDLTGSPLGAMRETTSLKAPDAAALPGREEEPAPPAEAPQVPLPPVLPPQGGGGPGGGGGGGGAGPGTARAWGPMSREVMAEINDPHVAAQLFIEQVRAGNPNARAIRNADMVVAAWRYTYRRYTTPPMAWLDSNGNIVIDGTRVDPRIAPGYGPGGAGF